LVATVTIRRWTGSSGSPTKTDITSINTRDNAYDGHSTGDTTHPVKIPTSGTKYGYWVPTRLSCDVTPAGTINNIKWYTDGANSFGTGVTCKMNTATGYVQATGTQDDTGDQLTTGAYATLAGTPTDAFGFTSSSLKSVTGSISNPSTGDFGDFVVYQIEVGTTASPGASAQETFTWTYDET
jgi:hypothetical protein